MFAVNLITVSFIRGETLSSFCGNLCFNNTMKVSENYDCRTFLSQIKIVFVVHLPVLLGINHGRCY